jgi:hypothetical protein
VRPEILSPEPHRGDLAATGPAGPRWAALSLEVKPDGRRHGAFLLACIGFCQPDGASVGTLLGSAATEGKRAGLARGAGEAARKCETLVDQFPLHVTLSMLERHSPPEIEIRDCAFHGA